MQCDTLLSQLNTMGRECVSSSHVKRGLDLVNKMDRICVPSIYVKRYLLPNSLSQTTQYIIELLVCSAILVGTIPLVVRFYQKVRIWRTLNEAVRLKKAVATLGLAVIVTAGVIVYIFNMRQFMYSFGALWERAFPSRLSGIYGLDDGWGPNGTGTFTIRF